MQRAGLVSGLANLPAQQQLPVEEGHVLHWESFGPRDGVPALVLHGGPGSWFSPALRSLCERTGPDYRWVAFDQRGCGRSTPRGSIVGNDTHRLIADIEALRRHLGLARWIVVGGSWGATLALAYGMRHPDVVSGLILRSTFIPSTVELEWFFGGAAHLNPDAWRAFGALVPGACAQERLSWLGELFAGCDDELQQRVAAAWLTWERALAGDDSGAPLNAAELRAAVDRYRIQSHYLRHCCWLPDRWLTRAANALQQVPVLFLHGRQDAVCRPAAVLELHRKLTASRFCEVAAAGHDPFHEGMEAGLREALRLFAREGHF